MDEKASGPGEDMFSELHVSAVQDVSEVHRFLSTALGGGKHPLIYLFIYLLVLSREIYEEKDFAVWLETDGACAVCGHPRTLSVWDQSY